MKLNAIQQGGGKRNPSVDVLKFIAAILITNSHMELLYGDYAALATGGAIGDVLFFFCSGFTLFMGRGGRFDNWYKRRVNRIYPTVFAWAILSAFVFGKSSSMDVVLLHGGGWFVSCIMLYYVVLYFVRKLMMAHLWWIMGVVLAGCSVWMALSDTPNDFNMYGDTYFKWFHYFIFMLLGAIVGLKSRDNVLQRSTKRVALEAVLLLLCIASFYAFCALKSSFVWNKLQIISLLPLGGVTYYTYRLCGSTLSLYLYNSSVVGWFIKFIGGLCLEIYIVQTSLFTDKMNSIFPLNLLIMFAIVVLAAYVLRCASRIFAQTFRERDYDWPAVFKAI